MKVLLCCIAKHEHSYIQEWVNYNLLLGFDRILIYDNEDIPGSIDFVKTERVSIKHFPGVVKQFAAYKDCVQTYQDYDFIAFFDVDEFLVLKQHNSVQDLISYVMSTAPANTGAIGINWVIFGNNGREDHEQESVLERFTRPSRDRDYNNHVKSIVRPSLVSSMGCHHAEFYDNRIVTVNLTGKPFFGPKNNNMEGNELAVLHHYWTKSTAEYLQKCKRGRADTHEKRDSKTHEDLLLCQKEEDASAILCRNRLKLCTGQSAE